MDGFAAPGLTMERKCRIREVIVHLSNLFQSIYLCFPFISISSRVWSKWNDDLAALGVASWNWTKKPCANSARKFSPSCGQPVDVSWVSRCHKCSAGTQRKRRHFHYYTHNFIWIMFSSMLSRLSFRFSLYLIIIFPQYSFYLYVCGFLEYTEQMQNHNNVHNLKIHCEHELAVPPWDRNSQRWRVHQLKSIQRSFKPRCLEFRCIFLLQGKTWFKWRLHEKKNTIGCKSLHMILMILLNNTAG